MAVTSREKMGSYMFYYVTLHSNRTVRRLKPTLTPNMIWFQCYIYLFLAMSAMIRIKPHIVGPSDPPFVHVGQF